MTVEQMKRMIWIAVAIIVAMIVFGVYLDTTKQAFDNQKNPGVNPEDIKVADVTTNIWDYINAQNTTSVNGNF